MSLFKKAVLVTIASLTLITGVNWGENTLQAQENVLVTETRSS